jgi:hypothetical protein
LLLEIRIIIVITTTSATKMASTIGTIVISDEETDTIDSEG